MEYLILCSSIFALMLKSCPPQMGQISPNLALKVLLQFDKAINQALAQRVKAKISFKVWMCVFFNYKINLFSVVAFCV